MSILIVDSVPKKDIALSYGAAQEAIDAKISLALEGWWKLEADGWVSKNAYDIRTLAAYWRKKPYDPEACRLMESISHIGHLRSALPDGLNDANTERTFHALLKLIMRTGKSRLASLRYDNVLEFADQHKQPVVIELFDKAYGEYSNAMAQQMLYQGRKSHGVTAYQLFIPVIADVIVANSMQGREAGCAVVTHARMPGEHWANLRIPTVDEKGRIRSVLFSHCFETRGGDNSWMFNPS